VLVGFPRVGMNRAFKPTTERLPWRRDDEQFQAWCEGRTGYPIVDAGMRQLAQTGWMHNRLRMIVAMFLSKNLFIDWRWGERHFMRHLVDGDLATNNGGWQWSASTGTDAVPTFASSIPGRSRRGSIRMASSSVAGYPSLWSSPASAIRSEVAGLRATGRPALS